MQFKSHFACCEFCLSPSVSHPLSPSLSCPPSLCLPLSPSLPPGWSLGEHGEWAKYSNFGVATRVPLIIYDHGMTAPHDSLEEATFPFIDVFRRSALSFHSENGRTLCRQLPRWLKKNSPLN